MNSTYLQKITRLALALGSSPRDIPSYAAHLPLWGTSPIRLGLPWFSYRAIRQLKRRLQPNQRVLELGSGGSTFFFSRHCAQVVAMESDSAWYREVTAFISARGLHNTICELHPLDDSNVHAFRENQFFHRLRHERWDVIAIDCFCGFSTAPQGFLRPFAFELALKQLNPGGMIVLDDSWMYPELLRARSGWSINDYVGPGPCRYGVTSTAIFDKL